MCHGLHESALRANCGHHPATVRHFSTTMYVLLGFTSPASQPGINTLYQKYSGKNAYHPPESAGISQIRGEKVLIHYFKVQKSRFCQIWLL